MRQGSEMQSELEPSRCRFQIQSKFYYQQQVGAVKGKQNMISCDITKMAVCNESCVSDICSSASMALERSSVLLFTLFSAEK